ncbi:MAG: DNA photolyase [Desulfobacterales bacterium]|nr:DNA photolyase [Desulfobacterales bacterium]
MQISKLFIDKHVADFPDTLTIQENLQVPFEIIHDIRNLFDIVNASDDPVQKGKETLYLTRNKGAFLKDCPGTHHYTCCGYKILHIGSFCTMDCSYCILQEYFHPPVLQYFVNKEDLFSELDMVFKKKEISRIGTGEFTDSLIWEKMTNLTEELVNRFAAQDRAVLELKTKTVSIKGLKELDHNRKTIASWSLNTEKIINSEERNTTSLSARLKAAAKCESWGYPLAFHFDPIVIYEGCEEEYIKVIDSIFSHVSSKNIVWISLGTFRYIPTLKETIQKRFPDSKIVYGEFIKGIDGKKRYFKPIRLEIYKRIVSYIKEIAPEVLVYFCMEDDEVWKKTMGFCPEEKHSLSKMLDESAVKVCKINSDYLK